MTNFEETVISEVQKVLKHTGIGLHELHSHFEQIATNIQLPDVNGHKVELLWNKILKKHIETINLLGRFPPNHLKLKTVDYSRVKRLPFVDDVLFNSKILISTLSLQNDLPGKDENNLFDSHILSTDLQNTEKIHKFDQTLEPEDLTQDFNFKVDNILTYATAEDTETCSVVIGNDTIIIQKELVTKSDSDDRVDEPMAKVPSEKELQHFLSEVGKSSDLKIEENMETSSAEIDNQAEKRDILNSKDFFVQEFKLIFSRIKASEKQNCYLAMVKLLSQFESVNCKNQNIV